MGRAPAQRNMLPGSKLDAKGQADLNQARAARDAKFHQPEKIRTGPSTPAKSPPAATHAEAAARGGLPKAAPVNNDHWYNSEVT